MFRLIFCLIASVAIGLVLSGWKSLRLRSAGNTDRARVYLRRAAWQSALSAFLLMFLLMTWPLKRETISTFEEVVESVLVPEQEVIETWQSIFDIPLWRSSTEVVTKKTTKNVSRQVPVEHVQRHFSIWLLVVQSALAILAGWAELWTCAVLWRRLPRRFLTAT